MLSYCMENVLPPDQIDPNQQQILAPQDFYPNSPLSIQSASSESIKYLEETDDLIRSIEMTLLNKVTIINESGEEEVVDSPYGFPYMNELGVSRIIALYKSHFHRGITLSSFNDDEISLIMSLFHKSIASMLAEKYREFDIQKGNLNVIMDMITNPIYATLKRAAYESDKNMLTKTQRASETRIIGDGAHQKKGFLGLW